MKENELITERDLAPTFWVCLDADTDGIYIKQNLAKMLSCMFNIPLTRPYQYNVIYRFTEDEVDAIQAQLEWGCVQSLTEGLVDVGTLLLLTNSPRCPYALHTNSIYMSGDHYTYYRFILKSDIVRKPELA